MPETETRVNIGKLEVKVEELQKDFDEFKQEFKKDFKALSNNINSTLTEMKICQVEFKATTLKVNDLERDKINPMEDDLAIMKPTLRLIKWVAGVTFGAVLTFALYLIANQMNLIS